MERRALRRDERGQTLQDYAIGIGLFLLAVTFVFTTLGGFLAPFTSGVSAQEEAQADQLADAIVTNYSTDAPNDLDPARLERLLNQSDGTIQSWYGISTAPSLNVTVTTLNGSSILARSGRPLAVDNNAAGRSTASAARIITLPDVDACRPACRLVVKIW
jgi:hypothetical protein